MTWLLLAPIVLQGGAMIFDEFHFHRRRGLGRWESLGHPLDTLSVLACFGYLLFVSDGDLDPFAYGALAGFSCLLITKDEFIHVKECAAAECWLHAMLFILHPIVLAAAYALRVSRDAPPLALEASFAVIAAFGLYQFFYWNLWRGTTWAR